MFDLSAVVISEKRLSAYTVKSLKGVKELFHQSKFKGYVFSSESGKMEVEGLVLKVKSSGFIVSQWFGYLWEDGANHG